jgi:isoquinoline 1-oxidoreductase beta subunit
MIFDRLIPQVASPDQTSSGFSRREFLRVTASSGGGLMLSLSLPFANGDAGATGSFVPNAFIRIDGDGQVVLTIPYVEMGQGTYTAIPMLIAEELEVGLQQVRVEHAPPDEKLYANPLLGGAGNGWLHRHTRGFHANAPGRGDRANNSRVRRGETLECRSSILPGGKRRGDSRTDG